MQSAREIVDVLALAPAILVPLVREVPEALRKRRPAPGKWSIHEHACHLADVHALFFDRLSLMLREDSPRIHPYDPPPAQQRGALLSMDLEDALDSFERDRAHLVALLRALTPQQWEREARHDEYSRYSVFIMFRHLALHDLLHGYRIEELALATTWTEVNSVASGPAGDIV